MPHEIPLQQSNLDQLVSFFAKHSDVNIHFIDPFVVLYCESVVNKELLSEHIDPKLQKAAQDIQNFHFFLQSLQCQTMPESITLHEVAEKVFDGFLIVCFFEKNYFVAIDAAEKPKRSLEESKSEVAIRGPREGFVEDVETNIALLRKRLKTSHLCYQKFILGAETKTTVALLYLDDVMNEQLLNEVVRRLKKVEFDGIYSVTQLESLIEDDPASIVPIIADSTRPDFVVASLLKGRFAILVDGNPAAIIGPANLTFLLKSPEDLHFPYYIVSFSRFFRLMGLMMAVFLPGFWTALISYHQDQIPFPLLATVTMARLGLPFPAPMELIIVFTLLEIFREAGARLPSSIGQTLTVVGGLIIGDAAIRAGFISPSVVVIVALSTLASYTIGNQSLAGSVTLLRMGCLLLSALLGLFGFFASFFIVVIYFSKLRSFGVPYLALFSWYGLTWRDAIRTFLKPTSHFSDRMPKFLQTKKKGGTT
jgi:Bacillus/Clostridium GerA spore germination protein